MRYFLCLLLLFVSLSFGVAQERSNGCGPQWLGPLNVFIPNGPVGLDGDLFRPACDAHDFCYFLKDDATQATCDTAFLNTMLGFCSVYSDDDLTYCVDTANLFYSLVDQFGEAAVSTRFTPNEASNSIHDFAKLELKSVTVLPSFAGDDLSLCVDVSNISSVNTGFKLRLFAADDRVMGELPEGDFWLAWYPLLEYKSFFLRSGETTAVCLGTDGFVGFARNISQFRGSYKLELWVDSSRRDVGLKLVDVLTGKLPAP